MNILYIVLGASLIFWFAYKSYGSFLAKKVFRLDDTRKTPAVLMEDSVDYVPVEAKFLAGQHFSAIAAAGPITGPILAGIMFGWAPALIWIVLGSIFIGGVLDMGSLVASIRHKAKSITEVVRLNVSQRAYLLFMLFIWITLVYVIVAFTDLTAGSFVGMITLENGSTLAGGAIATSSLLYLALPVIMGLFLRYTKMPLWLATVIFLPLVGVAIWVGQYIPLSLDTILNITPASAAKIWSVFILAYCLVAAVLPMWMLLQPRGHLGGYFLYAALAAAGIGLIFGGYNVQYPAFTKPFDNLGAMFFPMFPILFITVACGACSGFHALVASGTSAKQIDRESHLLPVAYGGMLIEGLLAMLAICSIGYLGMDQIKAMFAAKEAPQMIFASGLGHFCESLHIPFEIGRNFIALAISAFILTSLDTATRLARFIWQELVLPGQENKQAQAPATTGNSCPCRSLLGNRWVATLGVVILAGIMAFSGSGSQIWPVFGASNQLLAALTLLAITLFLNRTKRPVLFALLPLIFMLIISIWALLVLLQQQWGKSIPLVTVSIVLLILAVILCFLGGKTLVKIKK